jgi:hypothetical protein
LATPWLAPDLDVLTTGAAACIVWADENLDFARFLLKCVRGSSVPVPGSGSTDGEIKRDCESIYTKGEGEGMLPSDRLCTGLLGLASSACNIAALVCVSIK